MKNPESQFLHSRNPQLHFSGPVELASQQARNQGKEVPNEPQLKINAYLCSLGRHSLLAVIPEDDPAKADQLDRRRRRQVEARIIELTPENADALARFEAKIAREEGFGIDPDDIPDSEKMERLSIQREDQRLQLTEWVDYLNGPDASYDMWFKYYTLDAVMGLTKYDEGKRGFGRRSGASFALFPELDRESLAVVYDVMTKEIRGDFIGLPNVDPEVAKSIRAAAMSGNFARLYDEANKLGFAITPELRSHLTGQWRKYDASDQLTDSNRLADDIAMYRTGWCTAGRETAHRQLMQGDFYIWYSDDGSGAENVPRVAIRMERGKVREVRGVNFKQHMEPELGDIVMGKVRELPGGEGYAVKVEDMKRLTDIDQKITANPDVDLSQEDLRFMYELDRSIQGFGYREDPRIARLQDMRTNIRKDLVAALGDSVTEDQIGFTQEEFLRGSIKCYYGDLDWTSDFSPELPDLICGSLKIRYLSSAKGLSIRFPQYLKGDLYLDSLTTAEGLRLPETIGGRLVLDSLTTAEDLELPETIGGGVCLDGLTNAEGLRFPEGIDDGILSLDGLTTAKGLKLPRVFDGILRLGSLTNAEGLKLPEIFNGHVDLGGLTTAEGLKFPKAFDGYIGLGGLTTAKGLELPETIGGHLFLNSLATTEGLKLPRSISGTLDLDGLTTAKGLKLPETVGGDLYLNGLTTTEGLKLPETIGGTLYLNGLATTEDLELPETIGDGVTAGGS